MFVYTCVIIYAEDKEGGLRLNGMMEFFREWSRMTVGLKEAEKGRLIDSIAYYAITDATTDLTGKKHVFCLCFRILLTKNDAKGQCKLNDRANSSIAC